MGKAKRQALLPSVEKVLIDYPELRSIRSIWTVLGCPSNYTIFRNAFGAMIQTARGPMPCRVGKQTVSPDKCDVCGATGVPVDRFRRKNHCAKCLNPELPPLELVTRKPASFHGDMSTSARAYSTAGN
jgi:hypothetical protein